jgi:chromate transporter
MHRTRGGIMAGGLFILPGVVALMTLSAPAQVLIAGS